tara:strand:- start:1508 stop:1849 length:342 start_codon:yes stop_codon:yes gene_type:complete
MNRIYNVSLLKLRSPFGEQLAGSFMKREVPVEFLKSVVVERQSDVQEFIIFPEFYAYSNIQLPFLALFPADTQQFDISGCIVNICEDELMDAISFGFIEEFLDGEHSILEGKI